MTSDLELLAQQTGLRALLLIQPDAEAAKALTKTHATLSRRGLDALIDQPLTVGIEAIRDPARVRGAGGRFTARRPAKPFAGRQTAAA